MQIWLHGPSPEWTNAFGRQTPLVRAPADLGRRDAFLVEALDGPGVDELVGRLRHVGDLRVALGDVDDLRAGEHRQVGCTSRRRAPFSRPARRRPGRRAASPCDLGERLLGEVADQTGVGPVLDDRRRARCCRPTRPSSAAGPCAARTACDRAAASRSSRRMGPTARRWCSGSARRGRGTTRRIVGLSMFQARSSSRSPAPTRAERNSSRFSRVSRSRSYVTPLRIELAMRLRLSRKSTTVTCAGSIGRSRISSGTVHWATEPQPRTRTRAGAHGYSAYSGVIVDSSKSSVATRQ